MNVSLRCANLKPGQENRIKELEQELDCRLVALEESNQPAALSMQQLSVLQLIEKSLGVTLVAYEPTQSFRPTKPSPQHLARLTELERETGYVLVAYASDRQVPDVDSFQPSEGYETVHLSAAQFQRLQTVEDELGLILMAYNPRQ